MARIEVPRGKDNIDKNNTRRQFAVPRRRRKGAAGHRPGRGSPRLEVARRRPCARRSTPSKCKTAFEFPRDSASLLPYDCILFVNAPADAFDQMQLTAMRDAVYNFGSGFLMVGGANSFGPGGYHRTVVEEALPVTMDISQKKVLPKGALVIILHTCEFPEGNTWAKRITKQAIKVLGAQDEVGVLIYGPGGEQWVFELTPAGEYEKMVPKINAAEPGDMPSFASTMRKGLAGLKKSDAATKHMIIISDGDPAPAPPGLIQDFIDTKISVSTVAIFPHGGNEIGLMRNVASATGGRYYYPSDPNQLPSIFIKESKTLKRSMIQNKTITPEVAMDDDVLKGIEGLPPLKGYVITTAKGKPAETVLQVPPEQSEEEDDIDPILAITQYGLGKTAAFTSDLSPNWGADWMDWDKYSAFVHQLVTEISRVQKTGKLRMWTYTSGNEGVIVVEDFAEQESFLEIQARVSGPRDRTEFVPLKQVGPRRYQASVPLWGKGRYHIVAVPAGEDRKDDRAFGGFIIPYSPEYLRFRSNPLVLNDIAARTGGELLDKDSTAEDIYDEEPPAETQLAADLRLVSGGPGVPGPAGRGRPPGSTRLVRSSRAGWDSGRSAALDADDGGPARTQAGGGSQIEAKRAELPLTTETLAAARETASETGTSSTTRPPPNAAAAGTEDAGGRQDDDDRTAAQIEAETADRISRE